MALEERGKKSDEATYVRRLFAIIFTRLTLVVGVLLIEDVASWAVGYAASHFNLPAPLDATGLPTTLTLMFEALELAIFAAVLVLAAGDITATLLDMARGRVSDSRSQ